MIKSKTPQLIDAQNQISSIIFLEMGPAIHDRKNGLRKFNITTYVEVDNGEGQIVMHGIKENMAVFTEATFIGLWGAYTIADFEANVDTFMIQQIDYINSYTWTGSEAQSPVRFWSLASEDLEIVT
tara:strand:- start:563 stop:940 length:378 start_codon:yes stop_codon:yes gene_type:complete